MPIGIERVPSDDFGGFMLAFIIGIAGITLRFPLGILLALGRRSHLFIINKVSVAFIEVIRGVPLIVWLFTASLLLNYFLPPGTNFDLMLRVIIMVTLFAAAYMAEVIRGGLAALPRGQYEAADALGLDYWKAMRLIVLPQALKIAIPGIVNTFIGLFKDTTLRRSSSACWTRSVCRTRSAPRPTGTASTGSFSSSSACCSGSAVSACRAIHVSRAQARDRPSLGAPQMTDAAIETPKRSTGAIAPTFRTRSPSTSTT